MPITTEADRLMMLGDFGQTVNVGGTDIIAIFSNIAEDALGMASVGPRITCRASDVAGVTTGTAVVIDTVNYTVAEPVRPRVSGIASIKLRAVL